MPSPVPPGLAVLGHSAGGRRSEGGGQGGGGQINTMKSTALRDVHHRGD